MSRRERAAASQRAWRSGVTLAARSTYATLPFLAVGLLFPASGRGISMLDSIRKTVALPSTSPVVAEVALSAGVILTFLWLLIEDRIHPFAVYLAQLYLTL